MPEQGVRMRGAVGVAAAQSDRTRRHRVPVLEAVPSGRSLHTDRVRRQERVLPQPVHL